MPKLLRIDASSRLEDSHSRTVTDRLVERWRGGHPQGEVLVRDPIPHITDQTIAGFYTPKADHDASLPQATALSSHLIALLDFLGRTEVRVFTFEGTTIDQAAFELSKQAAERASGQLWAAA